MRGMAIFLAIAGAASAYVVGYHIDPVRVQWSGWAGRRDTLSQSLTCNFDSLAYVELFAGELGDSSQYVVTVFDDGKELTRSSGMQTRNHVWVKFENWNTRVAYAKGKKYEFRFTRSGGDRIQYYYDSLDPYHYGGMTDPNRQAIPITFDLAMRVHGRMKALDSTWWGYQTWAFGDTIELNERGVPAKAESAGVGMARIQLLWSSIWPVKDGAFYFSSSHREVAYARGALGCKVVGLLDYSATWASSRVDGSIFCPPINLDKPATDQENYWFRYVQGVVAYFDSIDPNTINVWEIWNEANDTVSFWKVPDTYYAIGSDTVRDMSALYARLCVIAESAVRSVAPEDTVLVGSLVRPQPNVEPPRMDPAEMLSYCYHYGQGAGWDGVSAHYYSDVGFVPAGFEAYAERLRTVMRNNGDYGGLWLTETGWPVDDETSEPARYLCKAFTTAAGTGALAQGGYDRICYFAFRDEFPGFGVLDHDDNPRPAFYAACQTARALTGKRFNGRAMTGETDTDSLVRMYEFEDPTTLKRTWVCWKDDDTKRDVSVRLPVRTNSIAAESLAYSRTPPAFSPTVTNDGWLSLSLNSRPVLISEKTAPQRPNLRVDSVRFVRARSVVRAWVTNHGTRATPVRSGSRMPYPTWAVLRANGDSLTQQVRTTSVAVNQQAEFTFDLDQSRLPDTVLFSVTVNPSQTYVELGTDDNTGHTLVVKP